MGVTSLYPVRYRGLGSGGEIMMGLLILATLAAALSPPAADVIINPDWKRKPGEYDFASLFPSMVMEEGASAMARVTCRVTVRGRPTDCMVSEETPLDYGVGAAVLKIAARFQLTPMLRNGVPVEGGTFSTIIRFQIDNDYSPPTWVHKPTEDQIKAVWPSASPDTPGQAILNCSISSKGVVSHCHVESETPKGRGFGAAALQLVPGFAIGPGKMNNNPISMSEARIPINFLLPKPRQNGVGDFGPDLADMTNAPWQVVPTAAQTAAAWPRAAPASLASGHAVIRCRLRFDSSLAACTVVSEDPPDRGFGEAALGLSARFRVRAGMAEPDTIAAARIKVPFTFTNPAQPAAAPTWIAKPNWVRFIEADQMTALYPKLASDKGVATGRGVVDCSIDAAGELVGCVVASEDPPGMGFGPAAIVAAANFTLNPWTEDGRPVDGSKFRLAVRFVEDPAAPAPDKPAGG